MVGAQYDEGNGIWLMSSWRLEHWKGI